MKTLFTAILGLIFTTTFAQFQGVIKFDKQKGNAVTKYAYYVSGDKVRVEETGADGKIKGIMLIDLTGQAVTAISPERKLYMDATNKRKGSTPSVKVEKTSNHKTIQGIDCVEWIVTSELENTKMSYWVAKEKKYDFFVDMLKILNRKDKISQYYLAADGIENTFTLEGYEMDLSGNEKTTLKVTSIQEKKLDEALFRVPDGFQKFEK